MLRRITTSIADLDRAPRLQYLLLAAIMALAAILRFYKLDEWSLWIDEVISAHRAVDAASKGLLGVTQYGTTTTLIGVSLRILPMSEFALRLVPALIGIASIPLLYFPMRRLFGALPSTTAILVLALSEWHIYWSQNSRFYTTMTLFYTLALLYFLISLEERKLRHIVLAVVCFTLAVLERPTSFLAVFVAVSYVLLAQRLFGASQRSTLKPRYVILPALVPIALFGAYDVFGALYLDRDSNLWGMYTRFLGQQSLKGMLMLGPAIVFRLGIPLLCLGIAGGAYLLTAERTKRTLFLFLATLVPLVIILPMSLVSLVHERYYTFAGLPFWALLAGVAVHALFTKAGRYGPLFASSAVLLLLISGLSQAFFYYQYQNGNRPDYRAAYQVVERKRSPDARVVTTHHQILLAEYYLGAKSENAYDVDPAEIERTGVPTWFVVESNVGPTPASLLAWLEERAQLVEVVDTDIPGKPVRLRVYSYGEP